MLGIPPSSAPTDAQPRPVQPSLMSSPGVQQRRQMGQGALRAPPTAQAEPSTVPQSLRQVLLGTLGHKDGPQTAGSTGASP